VREIRDGLADRGGALVDTDRHPGENPDTAHRGMEHADHPDDLGVEEAPYPEPGRRPREPYASGQGLERKATVRLKLVHDRRIRVAEFHGAQ
jgi:hypothetical protein